MTNSSTQHADTTRELKSPHVLIVGAGLAGLLLAILLDRQNVSYEIYEGSSKVRPLGAVMSLNPNILAAFDQLGLLEELKEVSHPSGGFIIHKANMDLISALTTETQEELFGYDFLLFARPRLYDILLRRIAPERLHFGKKVTSITQDKDGVSISCSDGTSYEGDILVGADGAHSGVRQGLYRLMEAEGVLPASDKQSLSKGYICLVGTTEPMDPTKYPILNENVAKLYQIIGDGTPYTWSAVNVPDNRICWNVVVQLAASAGAESEKANNAEWGPEANQSMIQEVKDFLVPVGGTLGDLIDATPKDTISRVFLEDKIFETWNHKRVVLIGDACHKLLPSAGQGAVNAMQDSVILANCIYDMQDVAAALQDYRDQRYPHVMEQYEASKMNAKIIYGQTFFEQILRNVVLNYMPKSIQMRNVTKSLAYRPQATFLPPPPQRGTTPVLPQKLSRRYQEELARSNQ